MTGNTTISGASALQALAVPAVCLLIIFLGYSSQWLFATYADLAPGPLTQTESWVFNTLLLCLWWCYFRACTVSPGGFAGISPPKPKSPKPEETKKSGPAVAAGAGAGAAPASPMPLAPARWCKKCCAPKPPRAHHCRHCGRCIPKMDHHCPWTGNCVSMSSFPHFLRFLVYANVSLWALGYFVFQRLAGIWTARNLPAYLGPPVPALVHLVLLWLADVGVSFALGILLYTTAKSWVTNTTMIEGWEVERHDALMGRYATGSWWAGADREDADEVLLISQIEFPYDVGFWRNMCQAMGSANPLAWLFPLSGSPRISPDGKGHGWEWEENGFNDREGLWPPPNPEKVRRARAGGWPAAGAGEGQAQSGFEKEWEDPEEAKAAFKARQDADRKRWEDTGDAQTMDIVAELEKLGEYDLPDEPEQDMDAERGWVNSDGDRLRDYGVDEDAEAEDAEDAADAQPQLIPAEDEDVPIGELLRRRKAVQKEADEED